MPELPWDKWYPQDWIADECLTLCSDATRGIWADVISRMMMSGTHQLTGSVIDLAKLCRTDKDAMTTAISELESTHTALVERCNGHVTLVSRRRSREVLARKQVRNRVRRFRDRHSEKPLKRNGNANVPSVSVSVSSSGSSLGIQEEGTGEGGSPSRMPADGWSWEQVWEVAQLPTVAVGKQTAQGYFDARTATAWVDASDRPVARTHAGLESDMRRWKVREPSMPVPKKPMREALAEMRARDAAAGYKSGNARLETERRSEADER